MDDTNSLPNGDQIKEKQEQKITKLNKIETQHNKTCEEH